MNNAHYHNAVNYRPELEPKFYSDISSFIVTLYNLNYNVRFKKVTIDPGKVAIRVAIDVAIGQLNASKQAHILLFNPSRKCLQ